MNFWFAFGTVGLTAFLYWAAYQSSKLMKTVEISGNLLLSVPEFIFKLVILGLCLGLASALSVPRPGHYFGWPSTQPAVDVVEGAALGLVIQFVVNILSTLAIRVFGPDIYSSTVIKGILPKNWQQWLLILPPLLLSVALEEVLFRALLIGGFSTVVNPWVMAIASSIIFGLMHAPQGRLGIAVTGLVGFIFAAIFIVSGSLTMVICTHYIINFIQIVRAKEDLAWFEKFRQKHAEERLAALRAAHAQTMQINEIPSDRLETEAKAATSTTEVGKESSKEENNSSTQLHK